MEMTPLEVTGKYLDGLTWPASKEEVIQAIERNGAPDDVIQTMRATPDERFVGPSDVHSSLWKEA